jgi:hypothetical protein
MSERGIQAFRWAIVVGYALLAWGLEHDGVSTDELGALFVTGAVLIVVILSMRWIANGSHSIRVETLRDEDERP